MCSVPSKSCNVFLSLSISVRLQFEQFLQMIWAQQDLCSLNAKRAPVDVLYDSLIMAFPGARLHCTIEPRSGSVVTELVPTSSGPHS
ncbi:hypothetical protein DPX16_11828 [Anabarilius grahami]|uniref:Uncharacterized protein n=1 Tax=Anabarilius grahami TaxID=495550 RepID=A0A3N0Z8G7_ANAGA|nr:hypothetical protein DPX16_11828 [Anabarilius grahami]